MQVQEKLARLLATSRVAGAALAAALAAVVALFPYHRALRFPFALDDYTFLYNVAGIEPQPFTLRRWLAVRGYYSLFLQLFGPDPLAWHVFSMLLHVANATLVYLVARRLGATRPAAWIATALFAASPLAFTVLYWAAGVQELGSTFFLLVAVLVAARTDRWRWSAVPLFTAAMLCKESVLVAPLVLPWVWGRRTRPVAAAMFAAGVAVFLASGVTGRLFDSDIGSPYATAYDSTLAVNLATQFVWFLAPWRSYPDRIAAPHPELVLPAATILGAAFLASLFTRGRGRRRLVLAAAWFVALLLPVLPLRQHSYAYYSYLPQVGFLILAGAALAWVAQRSTASTLARVVPVAAVAAFALCAVQNARMHETLTLPKSIVPHDSMVRYGLAAGAIVDAVANANLTHSDARVGFMNLPEQLAAAARTPGDLKEGMVRVRHFPLKDSFRDGKLLRLYFPQLRAAWVDSLTPADEGPETTLFFTSGFNDVVRIPDPAFAYAIQAEGKVFVNDRVGARRDLEHSLQLAPQEAAARIMLSGLEYEAGNIARATELIRGLTEADSPPELKQLFAELQKRMGGAPAATPPPAAATPAPGEH